MPNPIVLIHGYSATGQSFEKWKQILKDNGYNDVHIINWKSLVNEINIPDIAEGFDRALNLLPGLQGGGDFDCFVHSTGMLVIREWLTRDPSRISRLKHLIALAPATFGSPLARKGRSWWGGIIKGSHKPGPDFQEAGDQVLDALELASPYTWDLSHRDLFGEQIYYGADSSTPYVFVFCGNKTNFLSDKLAGEGSDGVVFTAGASFNTRKIKLDFSNRSVTNVLERVKILPWLYLDSPVVPVRDADHGGLVDKPGIKLTDLAIKALGVNTSDSFRAWHEEAAKTWWQNDEEKPRFQQFVIHAIDERGKGIEDFHIKLLTKKGSKFTEVLDFDKTVNVYSKDKSYRSFHVDLDKLQPEKLTNLWVKVILSTGTEYVAYTGYNNANSAPEWLPDSTSCTEVNLDVSSLLITTQSGKDFSLFYPRTTTLVEMIFDREPLPLDQSQPSLIAQ